jgi:hypothetical protein
MNPQAAENAGVAELARQMRLSPRPTFGPGQNVWALEGMSGLSSCCMAGSVGCCDMALQFANGNGNGNDEGMSGFLSPYRRTRGLSGCHGTGCGCGGLGCMGTFTDDLVEAVKGAVSVIPGASMANVTPENVQLIYDVASGAKSEELKSQVKKYNARVTALNDALAKVNAITDVARRTTLRSEHAAVVTQQAEYGELLLKKIDAYNNMCDGVEKYSVGMFKPEKINTYSLSQLSMPTLSGMGALGVAIGAAIPIIAVAGCIALCVLSVSYVVHMQNFYNYDMRMKGISPGLDERYSGFMGAINQITDTMGIFIKAGLVVGVAALGYMYWKKKWIFAEKAAPAVTMTEAFRKEAPKIEIGPALAGA